MDDVAFTHTFDAGVAFLTGRGPADPELWRSAVAALCRDARFRPRMPLVVDVREIEGLPAPDRVRALAASIDHAFATHAVAIVAQPGAPFGVARQVSAMAGGHVAVFRSLGDAMRWLSSSAPHLS